MIAKPTTQPKPLERTALVARLGETDQLYLRGEPSIALQQERIDLRMQLARMSEQLPEQQYFMTQAVALAEPLCIQLRTQLANLSANNAEETACHQALLAATAQLFAVYLLWFNLSKERKYLTIAEQVIKPFSHIASAQVTQAMVDLYQAKNSPALLAYWQKKLLLLK